MMDALSPRLILASASPRRKSLLSEAGYTFVVHPSDFDEESVSRTGLTPADFALRLAVAKANAVVPSFPNDVILAADTIVAFGEQILGKPSDPLQARQMLELLSGTTHLVITGLVVLCQSKAHFATDTVTSAVRMHLLTSQQIERYVFSEAWRGKAGGYGIQDNDPFVQRMTGCMTNIVGLPMTSARRMLHEAGVHRKRTAPI
jgi:septum formation protein